MIPPVTADSDAPELRLLGPTYSGSADPLAFTLRTWLDSSNLAAKPRITIVSGSATAIEPGRFSVLIDYRMTTIQITATVFAKFVMSAFKAKPDEIALLSEANTAYGRSFGPGTTNPASTVGEVETGSYKHRAFLYLHFPLHISNLRGAWEERPAIGRLPSPIKASNIPLSRQPDANTDYIVPPYSPRTSVADEPALSTLLTQIHNEHIGYIGLSASDVEDRIFLPKQIRTYCPNAVLVLFNSDLLYLHSDFNLDLRGTLLLSTYPLYNPEQFWTYPFGGHESRVPFAADNDEGVYDARWRCYTMKEPCLSTHLPLRVSRSGRCSGSRSCGATVCGRSVFAARAGRRGFLPRTAETGCRTRCLESRILCRWLCSFCWRARDVCCQPTDFEIFYTLAQGASQPRGAMGLAA